MSIVLSAPSSTWRKFALKSGLAYGIAMGFVFSFLFESIRTGIVAGVLSGIFFGIAFASLMRWFASRQAGKFSRNPPDLGGEIVLVEGPANLFRGVEGVGGYLWLTGRRLHFAPHGLNIQKDELTLPLSSVAGVETSKTAGLLTNGLLLRTSTGEEHRLVVNHNDRWKRAILDAKAELG